jgi:hypothetical protein
MLKRSKGIELSKSGASRLLGSECLDILAQRALIAKNNRLG